MALTSSCPATEDAIDHSSLPSFLHLVFKCYILLALTFLIISSAFPFMGSLLLPVLQSLRLGSIPGSLLPSIRLLAQQIQMQGLA